MNENAILEVARKCEHPGQLFAETGALIGPDKDTSPEVASELLRIGTRLFTEKKQRNTGFVDYLYWGWYALLQAQFPRFEDDKYAEPPRGRVTS